MARKRADPYTADCRDTSTHPGELSNSVLVLRPDLDQSEVSTAVT